MRIHARHIQFYSNALRFCTGYSPFQKQATNCPHSFPTLHCTHKLTNYKYRADVSRSTMTINAVNNLKQRRQHGTNVQISQYHRGTCQCRRIVTGFDLHNATGLSSTRADQSGPAWTPRHQLRTNPRAGRPSCALRASL